MASATASCMQDDEGGASIIQEHEVAPNTTKLLGQSSDAASGPKARPVSAPVLPLSAGSSGPSLQEAFLKYKKRRQVRNINLYSFHRLKIYLEKSRKKPAFDLLALRLERYCRPVCGRAYVSEIFHISAAIHSDPVIIGIFHRPKVCMGVLFLCSEVPLCLHDIFIIKSVYIIISDMYRPIYINIIM